MYRYIKLDGVGFRVDRDLTPEDEEISFAEYLRIMPPDRLAGGGITGDEIKIKEREAEKQTIKPNEKAWVDTSPPPLPSERDLVCEGCNCLASVYCRCS